LSAAPKRCKKETAPSLGCAAGVVFSAFTVYDFDNRGRPERSGKLDAIVNHMGNFFDCIAARRRPISDVESQHRSVSTCHLGTIACRLGRRLEWDPAAERFVSDTEADAMLSRPQRAGFEVRA
jgi:myo-inositol 2-dehydrogenase/D-chiro-inositol 1-dehydrogenase